MSLAKVPLEPNQIYHVWTHANGNENLFRENDNYRYFLKKYLLHVHPVVDTFAYCLMPNHLHLMVRIKSEGQILEFLKLRDSSPKPTLQGFETLGGFSNVISLQFSHLFNSYTQSYNKYFHRRGSLFIPNFKRKKIDSESYYGTCIAYIHNNPVHHSFVRKPDEWPHSSWHSYVSPKKTNVCKKEGIDWFGNMENFLRVHREIVSEKLEKVFE